MTHVALKYQQQTDPLNVAITTHQLPFTVQDMWCLFIHLLRSRQVLLPALDLLRPEQFNPVSEAQWAVLWASIHSTYRKYEQLTFTGLQHEIYERIARDPYALMPDAQQSLLRADQSGVVYSIMYGVPEHELMPQLGLDLLKRFLSEREVFMPLQQRMMQGAGQSYAGNLPDVLGEARRRLSRIDALGTLPIGAAMPQWGAPLPKEQEYFPTGISFVDNYIRGQRAGDCNGILGVFGSGKTTHCVDFTLRQARNYYHESRRTGRRSKLSVFVTYEEDEDKLTPRIWSNAAMILRTRMEQMKWELLTQPGRLEPYELELQERAQRDGGLVLSERERYEAAMPWYNEAFVLLDFSGSNKYPNVGKGYVPELAATLEKLAVQRGQEIGTVVIDYAKIMCRRYMTDKNIHEDRFRILLGTLGDELKKEIAVPFQSTVWLAHQFNPDQNKRSPTTLLSHEDASESKSFAENMPLCLCLGVRDKATGCIVANWSKLRYGADDATMRPPAVVMNDWRFTRLVDMSGRYQLDRITNRFIDSATASQIQGVDDSRPQRGPQGISPASAVMSPV